MPNTCIGAPEVERKCRRSAWPGHSARLRRFRKASILLERVAFGDQEIRNPEPLQAVLVVTCVTAIVGPTAKLPRLLTSLSLQEALRQSFKHFTCTRRMLPAQRHGLKSLPVARDSPPSRQMRHSACSFQRPSLQSSLAPSPPASASLCCSPPGDALSLHMRATCAVRRCRSSFSSSMQAPIEALVYANAASSCLRHAKAVGLGRPNIVALLG